VVHRASVAMTAALLTDEGMGKRMHDNNGSGGGVCVLSLSHSHVDIYRLDKTLRGKTKELQQ
jgi:hypothetical protein